MPRTKSKAKGSRKLPPVLPADAPAKASPAALRRGTQSTAIALLLDAIPTLSGSKLQEGGRFLICGASGKGKTFFAMKLIREMQRRGMAKSVVIHDVKDPLRPGYEGKLVSTIAEARRALLEGEPCIVCRPGIDAEAAAGLVKDLVEAGESAALLLDEMVPALKLHPETGEPMNQVFAGSNLTWMELHARSLRGSSIKLVNLPKVVPTSAVDNANAYTYFGVGGRSLEYSLDLRLVARQAGDVVATLERGQCCVFFADRAWDGVVYGPE